MNNFRGKAIIWALGPAVIAAAASGCGTQVPSLDPSTVADRPVAFRVDAVHSDARRVYERFAGTQEQRTEGEVLRAYAGNGAMDECLTERGFPEWDWSLSRGYPAPYDPLTPTLWFAEPGGRVFSDNEVASGPYLLAESEMNSDKARSSEYETAIDDCLEQVPPASDVDLVRAGQPAGTARLVDEWRRLMAEAGSRFGGEYATYVTCMDASDIPALEEAQTSFSEIGPVMTRLAGQAGPPPAPGADPSTYSESWNRFLDQEGDVIDADLACREEVYRRGIENIAKVVAEFEGRFASDIARAEAGWSDISAKAADIGYRGHPGPIGG